MIADLLQRAAVIYFHFNSDADIRGGERHFAIRHAEPFPWWRFYMTYSKTGFLASLGNLNQFTCSLFWSYLNYRKSISEVLSNSICLQKNPAFKPYPRKD